MKTNVITIARKILVSLSGILLAICAILPALTLAGTGSISGSGLSSSFQGLDNIKFYQMLSLGNVGLTSYLLFLLVGLVLVFMTKPICQRFGYALMGVSAIIALSTFMLTTEVYDYYSNLSSSSAYLDLSIGAIIAIIGVVFFFLGLGAYILENFLCKDEAPQPIDNKVYEVKKWKALLDDGIITEKEFALKRNEILGLSEETKAE